MAEKKNKKAPAKKPEKKSAPPPSGKKGCFLPVFLSGVFLVCLFAGGGFFFSTPAGSAFLQRFAGEDLWQKFHSFLPSGKEDPSLPAGVETPAIPKSMPADYALGVKLIDVAEANYSQKQYEKARDDARIALQKFPYSDPHWHRAAELVTKSSFAILRTPGDTAFEKKRVVTRKGDTVNSLALRCKLTAESILLGNPALQKGLKRNSPIPERTTVYLYCGKWNIKISNARKRLFVMDGSKLFAVYPIGIADEFDNAEIGIISTVTAKITDPAWKLGSDIYKPGHPMNILGRHSMEFRDGSGRHVFRIHGTNREENVGRTIKGPGCISMKNENIKELFHLIPTGTRVEVIR